MWPTPAAVPVDPDLARKQAAVDCYPSQLLALEAEWRVADKLAAPAPEQHWRLAPPPEGWEGLRELDVAPSARYENAFAPTLPPSSGHSPENVPQPHSQPGTTQSCTM